jgi:hypothetical protein
MNECVNRLAEKLDVLPKLGHVVRLVDVRHGLDAAGLGVLPLRRRLAASICVLSLSWFSCSSSAMRCLPSSIIC